jgi:hypothetical protein
LSATYQQIIDNLSASCQQVVSELPRGRYYLRAWLTLDLLSVLPINYIQVSVITRTSHTDAQCEVRVVMS